MFPSLPRDVGEVARWILVHHQRPGYVERMADFFTDRNYQDAVAYVRDRQEGR